MVKLQGNSRRPAYGVKRRLTQSRGSEGFMRLKSLFAGCADMLLAGSVSAQRTEYLPTSSAVVKIGTPAPAPSLVAPALEPENTLSLDLSTGGRVVIQLRPDVAP